MAETFVNTYSEPTREVPIVDHYDVVVCGGGPAGVMAAIAAARSGAKTALIETHGCLGGIWTAGLLSWILDAINKAGLLAEMLDRLEQRGARQPIQFGAFACDPEVLKLLLEEMCVESGVRIRLHTRVVAAARDTNNRLRVAITESKSGREAWAAKIFVDATGDGDLAAQAGCGFDIGHPETGQTQPMTLLMLIGGIHLKEIEPWAHVDSNPWRSDSKRLLETLAEQGVVPTYGAPGLFCIHENLFGLGADHQYGISALDAQQITEATIQARREVHAIVDALRAHGGPWKDVRLVATAEQIGVREGRRIRGRYQVTVDDLTQGTRHDDAVCHVTFKVDVHSLDPKKGNTQDRPNVKPQPYDIPLRALIARDVDGLLLAGRCISGDFLAHSSYRVTGNAAILGQAAGTVAALAAKSNRLPHELSMPEIQQASAKFLC